jgi:hypothetical protein
MDELGYVSTEGGPLLLIDRDAVSSWFGIEGDDYDRACRILDQREVGGEIPVGEHRGLLWGVPTGTTEIWRITPDSLVLSRNWLDPEAVRSEQEQSRRLVDLPQSHQSDLGRLAVRSGWVVILWATENGSDIVKLDPADGLALDLSVGNAGIIVSLPAGEYLCSGDEVQDYGPSALRCWVTPEGGVR